MGISYFSGTYFNFVHQMGVLFNLHGTSDTNRQIVEFIRHFETEWSCPYVLSLSGSHGNETIFRFELPLTDEAGSWIR